MEARFDRLISEQQSAIQMTDAKIVELTKFSHDYASLKPKLDDLAKSFTRKTLIPFSPRALVPATLIHTNELLVHLGGDKQHFAEISTFQALRLLDRRMERIDSEIKKLMDQRKLLSDREAFTSQFNVPNQEEKELEIREEYDPDQEKEWLQRHKMNVKLEKQKINQNKQINVRFADDSDSSASSYEDPLILFNHSNHPAALVFAEFTDWSKASPADVCAMVQKSVETNKKTQVPKSCLKSSLPTAGCGDICSAKQNVKVATHTRACAAAPQHNKAREPPVTDVVEHEYPFKRDSPISDVIERDNSTSQASIIKTEDNTRPISRFRVLRKQQN